MANQRPTDILHTADAVTEIDFGELPELIGYQVRRVGSTVFQTFNDLLGHLDLAPGQYSLLRLIALNPGLTQQALCDAAGIDRSTIAPITNSFVKKRWLRRARRSDDKRAYSLQLTPLAMDVLRKAQPLIREHEKRLTKTLSRSDQAALLHLLKKMSGEPEEPKLRLARSQIRRLSVRSK